MAQKKKTYSVSGIASSPHYEYKKTKDTVEKDGYGITKTEKYGRGDNSSKKVTTVKTTFNKKDVKKADQDAQEAYNVTKTALNDNKGKAIKQGGDFGSTVYSKGSVKTKNGKDVWKYKETEVDGSYKKDEDSKRKKTISGEEALANAYAKIKKKKK